MIIDGPESSNMRTDLGRAMTRFHFGWDYGWHVNSLLVSLMTATCKSDTSYQGIMLSHRNKPSYMVSQKRLCACSSTVCLPRVDAPPPSSYPVLFPCFTRAAYSFIDVSYVGLGTNGPTIGYILHRVRILKIILSWLLLLLSLVHRILSWLLCA